MDITTLALAKKYTEDTVVGTGALKGEKGDPGPQGIQGVPGEKGVTYTPYIDPSGNMSWTNDGGLENPQTVNITGPQGLAGADGKDGTEYQIYSTEERVVGKWIDGKPLYRKILLATSPMPTSDGVQAYIDISISDIPYDFARIADMVCLNESIIVSGVLYATNGGHQLKAVIEKSLSAIRLITLSTAYGNLSCHIFLEYTKTTDEATVAVASPAELDEAYNEGVQSA